MAVVRKESAETQGYVTGHYMEVHDNKNLEVISFVPSAVCRASSSAGATRSAMKSASSFDDLAAVVTEEGSTPQTINPCRNFDDCRRMEQGETLSTAHSLDVIK